MPEKDPSFVTGMKFHNNPDHLRQHWLAREDVCLQFSFFQITRCFLMHFCKPYSKKSINLGRNIAMPPLRGESCLTYWWNILYNFNGCPFKKLL